MAITLTEALAELKTLKKRIAAKQQLILQYVVRDERMKDPLESGGGTKTVLAQETQALKDLWERYVKLRAAIAEANAKTMATIGKVTRSIAEWLIWRREVAKDYQNFLLALQQAVLKGRTVFQVPAHRQQEVGVSEIRVAVGVDEKVLGQDIEGYEEIVGNLDAQLSLLNARTEVQI
jgi:hypothetical protein